MWIIDFGVDTAEEVAAQYEMPFEYVRRNVMPVRSEKQTCILTVKDGGFMPNPDQQCVMR